MFSAFCGSSKLPVIIKPFNPFTFPTIPEECIDISTADGAKTAQGSLLLLSYLP